MTVFLTLPEKNNTPILSEYGTREANLTNVVAGAAGIDYPKSMTINSGSWTTQATILVYDDILRFDKGTLTNTTPITKDNFKFSTFQTNIFWWVDNLIGMNLIGGRMPPQELWVIQHMVMGSSQKLQ